MGIDALPFLHTIATLLGQREATAATLVVLLLVSAVFWLLLSFLVPKCHLAAWATMYFWVSGDKKMKKPDDFTIDYATTKVRKTVIFIRHGESEWNTVFNKGFGPMMPVRLIKALIGEAMLFFDQDSIFCDSPLNQTGVDQAWDLLRFIAAEPASTDRNGSRPVKELTKNDLVSIIRGDIGNSVVVCSCLRRAISTALIALSTRFLRPNKDKMLCMTRLQEISRNVDTLSLTPAYTMPLVPSTEVRKDNIGELISHFYRTRVDCSDNTGNKTLANKAIDRHSEFTKWMFAQKAECFIVSGHSIYFREFFKSYLPSSSDHIAKSNKMVNAGCVAFDFYNDNNVHQIDPDSIKVVHGSNKGFETKGKKKAKQQ